MKLSKENQRKCDRCLKSKGYCEYRLAQIAYKCPYLVEIKK